MDDKVKGLEILDKTILLSTRHKDYLRVTALAKEYFDIFTGQNLKEYLRRIVKREDDAMFEQRCNLYHSTIPATVSNLEDIFNKPLRSNRIYNSITHPSSSARNEIIDRMGCFYQGEAESGVDAYLQEKWKYLNVYDPNAYTCIEFGTFNPVIEKPFPFPLEYTSTEIINYEARNGKLEWVIAQLAITYRTDQADKMKISAGSRYIMYLENWAIVLTEVDKVKRITDIANPIFYEVKNDKGIIQSVYVLQEFNLKSNGIPLFRAGYRKDAVTAGRTCKSIIHEALLFFKKELKTGSEFDMVMSLHAFPVRVQYGQPCPGDKEKGIICNSGKTINGKNCPVCDGKSAIPLSTSTQDVLMIKPPKNQGDPVLDLAKAFVYITPPVDFVKFQEEYLDRLTEKAKGAVFAAESIQRKTVDKTATEMDYSYDNLYDTFHPYGQKYSYAWRFIVRQIAVYTDNFSDALELYHQFPKDLKLKSLTELLVEAKLATDSGLSQHAVSAINNDVLEAMYADDQNTLTRIKIRDKFHPFSGKRPEEVQSIMMSGEVLPYYKTLYQYFDVIFQEIDNEMADKFYLMAYENQKMEVRKRVDTLTTEVESLQAKRLDVTKSLQVNVREEEEEAQ